MNYKIGDKVKLKRFSKEDVRFRRFINKTGKVIGVQNCEGNKQFVRVSYGRSRHVGAIDELRRDYIDVGDWRLIRKKS